MAYADFAYYYDSLNQAADYDALYSEIQQLFKKYKQQGKIIADLGCGTGEISLRLAQDGFDVIAADASMEMLSVAREKAYEQEIDNILFLNQSLESLDLYGTIHGALATFDTLNHLAPEELENAIGKVSLFMEDDSLFIFDVNTPYKHEKILADNSFVVETEDGLKCVWENHYLNEKCATQIALKIFEEDELVCQEEFLEYSYSLDTFKKILENNMFECILAIDGETFEDLNMQSQRALIIAKKKPEGKRSI